MSIRMKFHLFLLVATAFLACKPIPELPETGMGGAGGARGNEQNTSSILIIPKKKSQQQAPPTVTIDWLSPTSADISVKNVGGKVEVKVRINSPHPITLDQIDILVNGKPVGNKAGEVGLLKRPEFKDQVLTAQVPVEEGTNNVQVVVTASGDQRFFAESTIIKNASGLKVESGAVTSSNTRVIWTQPDAFALKGNEMFNTKSQELEVRFNITTPDVIEKKDLKLLVNKIYKDPSPAAEFRGSNGNYYFKDVITLNENATINEVALKVNARSGAGESQRLKINYSPSRPNLYLLSIGTKTNLKYTTKDARDFAGIFQSQGKDLFRLYNQVTIDTLIGKAATSQEIRGTIESIGNKLRTGAVLEDDVVVIYISSHGFIDDKGDFRIQGDDYAPERRMSTSVSYKIDILNQLEALPCKKLLFLDACHSGGAKATRPEDINKAAKDLKNAPKGLAIFTSSSDKEESHEDLIWQNGAFTEVLIKALKDGAADRVGYGNGNGIISLNELEKYVTKEVPPMVKSVKSKEQHPALTRNELGDIPIFILRKQ